MTPISRSPCTIASHYEPIKYNSLVCKEFTAVLQERLTFTFRGDNFTYSTVSECRISRGNVHLTVSAVSDLTATVTECTDGTALCVQVLNVLHCCVLQVTVTHKAMAVCPNYVLFWRTMFSFIFCQLLLVVSIKLTTKLIQSSSTQSETVVAVE